MKLKLSSDSLILRIIRGNFLHYAPIMVVALAFGALCGLQWNSQAIPRPLPHGYESGHDSRVSLAIQHLEAEQEELKETIGRLRKQLDEYQQRAAVNREMLEEISRELARQKMLAGLLAVKGPGVQVILDDGQATPAAADPNVYLIHDYDLRDVVNLLWMAGSEAIAINDERVVATTSIYCVGSTIMVNDTRLSPPYLIRAIGDPSVQEALLYNPAYLREIKRKAELYGLRFEITEAKEMTLPAYKGSFPIRYARLGD